MGGKAAEPGKLPNAMAKETMRRHASDNPYLHRDFHGALSVGIEYLHERFGEDAVREYLRAFTRAYYAPLIEAVKSRGLAALGEHFERIYAAVLPENGPSQRVAAKLACWTSIQPSRVRISKSVRPARGRLPQCAGSTSRKRCTPSTA